MSELLAGTHFALAVEDVEEQQTTEMVTGPEKPTNPWTPCETEQLLPQESKETSTYEEPAYQAASAQDIQDSWQYVVLDMMVGLCCEVPFVGFCASIYILWKYSKPWWGYWGMKYHVLPFGEVIAWIVVLYSCFVNTQIAYASVAVSSASGAEIDKNVVWKLVTNIVAESVFVTTVVVGRIVPLQSETIAEQVRCHKKLAKKSMDSRAKEILLKLQDKFPEFQNQKTKELDRQCAAMCAVYCSQLILALWFMCWVLACLPHPGPGYIAMYLVIAFIFARRWGDAVEHVLLATANTEHNSGQVLLFSCLTMSPNTSSDVDPGRWTLKKIRKLQKILKIRDQPQRSILSKVAEALCYNDNEGKSQSMLLSLTDHRHIQRWWWLREWMTIDLLDESAEMNYNIAFVIILVLCLLASALVEWLQNPAEKSPGIVIAGLLVAFLIGVIYLMMSSCVMTNSILSRDSFTLTRAAIHSQVDLPATTDCGSTDDYNSIAKDVAALRAASLLTTLAKEAATSTVSKLLIFGVPVTSGLTKYIVSSLMFPLLGLGGKMLVYLIELIKAKIKSDIHLA